MTEELKPCPFCGHKKTQRGCSLNGIWHGICVKCKCVIKRKTEKGITTAWNRRVK